MTVTTTHRGRGRRRTRCST